MAISDRLRGEMPRSPQSERDEQAYQEMNALCKGDVHKQRVLEVSYIPDSAILSSHYSHSNCSTRFGGAGSECITSRSKESRRRLGFRKQSLHRIVRQNTPELDVGCTYERDMKRMLKAVFL